MAWSRSTKRGRCPAICIAPQIAAGIAAQVAPPASQVDSAEHQFLVSVGHQLIDIAQDFAEGKRAAAAAHKGDHAEGAAVVASVLHLEVGASLLVVGIEDRRGQQFGVGKNIFHHNRARDAPTGCGRSSGPESAISLAGLAWSPARRSHLRRRSRPGDACASCRPPARRRRARKSPPGRAAHSIR